MTSAEVTQLLFHFELRYNPVLARTEFFSFANHHWVEVKTVGTTNSTNPRLLTVYENTWADPVKE